MARSAKPRKRKPAPQRSKLPRYVVKLHPDDFFDEEDAEVLHFDNFDDAVECCADLGIPFFTFFTNWTNSGTGLPRQWLTGHRASTLLLMQ